MTNRALLIALTCLIVSSCDPLDKIPSPETAEAALQEVEKDTSLYSEIQLILMRDLCGALQEKYSVNDSVMTVLVSHYNEAGISYNDLLADAKVTEELADERKKEENKLAEEVYQECVRRQEIVDATEKRLDAALSTKLTSLETGHNSISGSYAQFKVVYTNHTGKPIRGRVITIKFYDGFDKYVHGLDLTSSDEFIGTDETYLVYRKDDDKDREEYDLFSNKSIRDYRIKCKTKSLNIDSEIVKYPEWFVINYDWDKNRTPSTYCPYIDNSDSDYEPLRDKVKEFTERYDNLMRDKAPGLAALIFGVEQE